MPLVVTSIYRYPVKSGRRHEVQEAVVEPWGLAGDRRWMLVDSDGVMVTAREQPRLVLVTPRRTPGSVPGSAYRCGWCRRGGTLRVGDQVEILDEVDSDGPPR